MRDISQYFKFCCQKDEKLMDETNKTKLIHNNNNKYDYKFFRIFSSWSNEKFDQLPYTVISRDRYSFSPISRQGSIVTLCHVG